MAASKGSLTAPVRSAAEIAAILSGTADLRSAEIQQALTDYFDASVDDTEEYDSSSDREEDASEPEQETDQIEGM